MGQVPGKYYDIGHMPYTEKKNVVSFNNLTFSHLSSGIES